MKNALMPTRRSNLKFPSLALVAGSLLVMASTKLATAQTLPNPLDLVPTPAPPPGNLFFDYFLYDNLSQPREALGSGQVLANPITPRTFADIPPNVFLQWNVTDGSVDLVGGNAIGVDDLADGGRYTDLGGSTNDPGSFTTRAQFPFSPLLQYEFRFEYRATLPGKTSTARATVGGQTFEVMTSSADFQTFRSVFRPTSTLLTGITFQGLGLTSDGVGIDAVLLNVVTPEPTTLLSLSAAGTLALRRRRKSASIGRGIESMEPRRLLAATLSNGVLTVTGSDRNEHIEVDLLNNASSIEVNIERPGGAGGADIEPTETFAANTVNRIVINALEGNDDVDVAKEITQPSEIRGGDGDDTLSGGSGADYLNGGSGSDVLSGNVGNDTLSGGSSRNLMFGGDGNDLLHGSSGRDTLRGEGGNDRLLGGDGDDLLDGGGNVDRLFGEAGNDQLFGGGSVDRLYGGAGNDILRGGAGKDFLYGDADQDKGQRRDADVLTSIELEF